ncbi:hypothetical protein [Halorussus litoreus]|uniref:hypothetical protein n=1 Tax=Halorussus litoreus TaxID=1710536 RepID=UPI000E2319F3|nr:hypothetical protein [Halorussus litoreus]
MGNEHSRRQVLGTGLAVGMGVGLSGWSRPTSELSDEHLSNELRIESDGGGMAAYEFTVTGDLEQVDDDDEVDGSRAWGHVGPERGTDTFRYSGDLDGIVLAGPATAFRNDSRIQLGGFPHPEGSLTSANFDATSGSDSDANVLRIESDGGGVAAYEFAVTGDVSQRDDDDQVGGNWAWGHVGPDRGTDEFEFTGEIGRFALAGPASVFLNGSAVTPDSGSSDSDRGLLRANPDREMTAVPDTPLLFEAVAPDHPSEFLSTDWYVDGREFVGPGTFHRQLGGRGRATLTYPFDSTGRHEVHVDAYERTTDGQRGDYVGTTDWLVEVGADGNRPPAVEPVAPDSPVPVSGTATERRTFEVAVSDPEGELDRVVWWESQCDYLVAVSSVEGANDGAALSLAPSQGCPLGAWAIDRNGAVSELRGWSYESAD